MSAAPCTYMNLIVIRFDQCHERNCGNPPHDKLQPTRNTTWPQCANLGIPSYIRFQSLDCCQFQETLPPDPSLGNGGVWVRDFMILFLRLSRHHQNLWSPGTSLSPPHLNGLLAVLPLDLNVTTVSTLWFTFLRVIVMNEGAPVIRCQLEVSSLYFNIHSMNGYGAYYNYF